MQLPAPGSVVHGMTEDDVQTPSDMQHSGHLPGTALFCFWGGGGLIPPSSRLTITTATSLPLSTVVSQINALQPVSEKKRKKTVTVEPKGRGEIYRGVLGEGGLESAEERQQLPAAMIAQCGTHGDGTLGHGIPPSRYPLLARRAFGMLFERCREPRAARAWTWEPASSRLAEIKKV
ncbi:hypothetical protein VTG60DRAFT_7324 [Thermothelomyces hinnuleus]